MTESALALLNKGKRPAHLAKIVDKAKAFNDFFSSGSAYNGLPSLSIGGKVFRMRLGDKEIVAKNEDGDTVSSMLVVLAAARPSKESKTYFAKEFDDDNSAVQPDCHSDDGVYPSASAKSPQSASCAVCPLNQLGTARVGKGKACRSFKRVIVVPFSKEHGLLRDPETDEPQGLALNIPTMSLKSMSQYVKELGDSSIPVNAVITKLKFVTESNYPQLEFSAAGWLSEEQYEQINNLAETDEKWKATIEIGAAFSGTVEPTAATSVQTAEKPAVDPAPKPAKAPAKSAPKASKPADEDLDVEDAPQEPAPAKKSTKATGVKTQPATVGKSDDDLLRELDDWGNGDGDE